MKYEELAEIIGQYIRSNAGPHDLIGFHRWLMVMAENKEIV